MSIWKQKKEEKQLILNLVKQYGFTHGSDEAQAVLLHYRLSYYRKHLLTSKKDITARRSLSRRTSRLNLLRNRLPEKSKVMLHKINDEVIEQLSKL